MSETTVQVQPDKVYGERDGSQLTLDWYMPESSNGAAVIFVNSGGFESGKLIQYETVNSSSWRFLGSYELTMEGSDPIPQLAQFSFEGLLNAGISVFDVRHSNAPHTVDKMLDDIRVAVEHIHGHAERYEIDPGRIGIFGASSGGFLAIAAGLSSLDSEGRNLIRTIAAYYPAGFDFRADVEAYPQIRNGLPALAVEDAVLDYVSLKNHIRAGAPSTLVIYGDQDFPFIVNPCRSICSEFPKAGINTECVVIEGVAHEFVREDGYHPEDGQRAQAILLDWMSPQLAA